MISDGSALVTVRAIVTEVSVDVQVNDDTQLIVERVIDSLTLISVVARLEKEFGIHIADKEIQPENFESIRAIAAFIASKPC